VRCRWATSAQGECAGVCSAFPAVLDEVKITHRAIVVTLLRRAVSLEKYILVSGFLNRVLKDLRQVL